MKYDDATWHSDGDFPKDLPSEAGATHIAMFLAWALRHDLGSGARDTYRAEALQEAETPGRLLLRHCDGQLTSDDFNVLGNRFAQHYYNIDDCMYYRDLETIFGGEGASFYHVIDSWETLRRIEPKLTQRLAEIQNSH